MKTQLPPVPVTDARPEAGAGPGLQTVPAEDGAREQVTDFARNLVRAVRTHQIYEGSSPVYDRFLQTLQQRASVLWEHMPELHLAVTEDALVWNGAPVHQDEERSGGLAFLLYKDGVRGLSFLTGFGGEEVVRLIEVFASAARLSASEEDDLVTLLWELDLPHLRYSVVDTLTEGAELSRTGEENAAAVQTGAVREEAAQSGPSGLSTADFDGTLYFLEDAELRRLAEEVEKEWRRDLWRDVINALLDRLEDGSPDRQERIVEILAEMLPGLLAAGRFAAVATVLRESAELATRPGLLPKSAMQTLQGLFNQLAQPETVGELVRSIEESPDLVSPEVLMQILGYFPPQSLGPLLTGAEQAVRPEAKRVLAPAIEHLASAHPERIAELLNSEDPVLAAAAARWAGRLRIERTTGPLVALLRHEDATLRLAAVEALRELRTAAGAGALQGALDDEEREVRIAAARALGAIAYTGARARLSAAIQSKSLREADLTEQIAFYQAFGTVADETGVQMLARMLNAKNWLGRREPSEVRACAAEALGRSPAPAARQALDAAAQDSDPVVRSAVSRALRDGSA